MQLLGLAVTGLAMIAVVFVVGVAIEVFVRHRWGIRAARAEDLRTQVHHQAVRSQLGGFGPGGGGQQGQ